jgi:hypothetical protein
MLKMALNKQRRCQRDHLSVSLSKLIDSTMTACSTLCIEALGTFCRTLFAL